MTQYIRAALAGEPPPFEYTTRQIADGIGVLVVTAVALIGASVLLLGAWGW